MARTKQTARKSARDKDIKRHARMIANNPRLEYPTFKMTKPKKSEKHKKSKEESVRVSSEVVTQVAIG
jgi:dsRNA-specific ribonuclease